MSLASHIRLVVLAASVLSLLVACSDTDASSPAVADDDRVVVASSFSILTELVEQIGGERVEILNLIPLGVDEHSYYPPTTLPRDLTRADLVIVNGYSLEESLLQIVVQNVRDGVPVVAASRGLTPLEGGHEHDDEHADEGHTDDEHADDEHADEVHADDALSDGERPDDEHAEVDGLVFAEGDPHFWLDPRHVVAYAENIRDALIQVDPQGEEDYRARASEAITGLDALHQELITTLSSVPSEGRRLVVFHNAFQYFAAAYDFEVIATVAPANPNQARSAAAIAEVIEIVRAAGVPMIFREPQYQAQTLELVAEESGTAVGIIHSVPSPDIPTYAEMMRANATALAEGLMPGG